MGHKIIHLYKINIKSERRKNSRKLSDIDQLITTLQNDLKEIENLSLIQKEKAKAKAEAEKNKK